MVDSRSLRLLALCAVLCAAAVRLAPAQDTDELNGQSGGVPDGQNAAGCFYAVGDNGEIIFTQILEWEADPYALRFEVIIRDAEGTELFRDFTQESRVAFSLGPGQYEYDIITRNLLDQAEVESGWQKLSVIEAKIPVLDDASPSSIYLDSLNGQIVLTGESLVEGASFFLVDETGKKDPATEVARNGDTEVTIAIDDRTIRTGTFDVLAVNPGGIEDRLEESVKILFQRPFDILASIGYAPMVFFADDWFMENWSSPFHGLGGITELDAFLIKRSWGYLGVGINASAFYMEGGTDTATISSLYFLAGVNALYKYRFSRVLHGVARVGGGIAMSSHDFDYDGFEGPSATSTDPFMTLGISGQYIFPNKMFVEGGIDWIAIMHYGHTIQGVRPSLRFGYHLF